MKENTEGGRWVGELQARRLYYVLGMTGKKSRPEASGTGCAGMAEVGIGVRVCDLEGLLFLKG